MSNLIHKANIEKGVFGEFSKIKEEFQELVDANNRNYKILEICELCDLIGAIDGYLRKHFNVTVFDAYNFSRLISEGKEEENDFNIKDIQDNGR